MAGPGFDLESDSGACVLNHCSRAGGPLREASPQEMGAVGLAFGKERPGKMVPCDGVWSLNSDTEVQIAFYGWM